MTSIDALAFDLRSAHHLANTAKAHGNWSAWRFLVIEERRLRRQIASGRTDLGGGSPSHSGLPSSAGDLGAPPHGVASPPPTLRNGTSTAPGLSCAPAVLSPAGVSEKGPRTTSAGRGEPGGRVAHSASAEIADRSAPAAARNGSGA